MNTLVWVQNIIKMIEIIKRKDTIKKVKNEYI